MFYDFARGLRKTREMETAQEMRSGGEIERELLKLHLF